MTPALATALADLDEQLRALGALRAMLAAGDMVGAERAVRRRPWLLPDLAVASVRGLCEASRDTTPPAPVRLHVAADPGVATGSVVQVVEVDAEGVRRIVVTAGSGEPVTPSLDYVGPGWPDGGAR